MRTKKLYKTPSIKVIEINQTDIIATSDPDAVYLRFDPEREEEGYGG